VTFFGKRFPQRSNVWLALLTLCVVFAAAAGVRETMATRTEALRQTLAAVPAQASTVTVSGSWGAIAPALAPQYGAESPFLSEEQTSEIASQLRGDLNKAAVPLAPASADWAALTTRLNPLAPVPPSVRGTPVQLEISYRQQLRQYARLVSGAFPGSPVPAASDQNLPPDVGFYPSLPVLVSEQTAAKFGLKPGSKLTMPAPNVELIGLRITLVVSGIFAPAAPNTAFWTSDATVEAPSLELPQAAPPYWTAGVLAGPGESEAVQDDFGQAGITAQWTFPLSVNGLSGGQAQPLSDTLTGLSSKALPLSGDVAPVADQLSASSGLVQELAPFIAAAQSADVLLWVLYVGLTVAGLVVLLLADRMVVLRRSTELAVIRARGASLFRLFVTIAGEAAVCCVPAAAAAAALALVAVPAAGGLPPAGATGAWLPVLAVLLVTIVGPALMAVWRNRLPRRRAAGRRRARVRPVAEVTLILAAVGGILVFRQQGLQAGSGVNIYTSAAPVLVAIPAVIVVFRLYPLVLRWLLQATARTSGAPAFLGLARASRTALTPALPAFALVLALSVAAFGGMVRDAVTNGEVAASWAAVGSDATIAASPTAPGFTIPADTARAIAAVPGVTRAAQVWVATWFTHSGTLVTGIAVDPAEYAALVAVTQGYPAMPAGVLTGATSPGAAQPVLASPAAAAALGTGTVTLSTQAAVNPVKVRIAGMLSGTPALPSASVLGNAAAQSGNSGFVIMPFAVLKSSATPPAPVTANEMLLTGSGIDRAQLSAALRKGTFGGDITYRSAVLAGLSGAPLQHGALTVITLSVIAAAALGLAVMLLELALGAAERDATLARLAAMGLGEGQRARVVALELLPAVIAAAVAAWACALVLPPVVRPVIDLSVFTGSSAAVPLVPDVAAVALPLAGLLVLAAASLGIEIGAERRRGVAASLRIDG
jgi:putative ABC transport system permease protein